MRQCEVIALSALLLCCPVHTKHKSNQHDACFKQCQCKPSHNVIDCRHNGFTLIPQLPHNARDINLDWNNIGSLEANAFANYTALRHLSVRFNNLMFISENAFTNLTHLRSLSLEDNWLETLSAGFLLPVSDTLTELSLAYNQLDLQALNQSLPQLPKLRHLDLSGSSFAAGPQLPQALSRSTNLKELIMRDVNFGDIGADFFDPLANISHIHKLDLRNSTIGSVSQDSFKSIGRVNVINFAGSHLSSDSLQNIISGLTDATLNTLSFQNIYLTNQSSFPGDLLKGLNTTGLKKLHLDGNHAIFKGSLPLNFFHPLIELHELFLEKCGLTSVPNGTFTGLTGLKKLSLRHNLISCQYGYPCDGLLTETSFRSLEELDLSDNAISVGNPDISFVGEIFSNLHYLGLSNNSIQKIGKGLFVGLNELTYLDLSFNPLHTIEPHSFRSLHGLGRLDIIHCYGLQKLSNETFKGLRNLNKLHLHNNAIQGLDKAALVGMPKLTELHMRGNRLNSHSLNEAVMDSPRLHYLDLGRNDLTSPPARLLRATPNLTRLYLDFNRIERCSDAPLLGHLRVLNLSHNLLPFATSCFECSFSPQLVVNLAHNPFHCGCDSAPSLLHQSAAIVEERSGHICSQSGFYEGQSIFSAPTPFWTCHTRDIVIPLVAAVLSGLIGLVVGCSIMSLCRHPSPLKSDGDGSESSCECDDCGVGMTSMQRRRRRRKHKATLSIVSDDCLIREDDDDSDHMDDTADEQHHDELSDEEQHLGKSVDVIVSESNVDDLLKVNGRVTPSGCLPV